LTTFSASVSKASAGAAPAAGGGGASSFLPQATNKRRTDAETKADRLRVSIFKTPRVVAA
jgi:hypothetical protein